MSPTSSSIRRTGADRPPRLGLLVTLFLPWRNWQKALLAIAAGCTIAAGAAFALNLV
jgi:hypothetical protein